MGSLVSMSGEDSVCRSRGQTLMASLHCSFLPKLGSDDAGGYDLPDRVFFRRQHNCTELLEPLGTQGKFVQH